MKNLLNIAIRLAAAAAVCAALSACGQAGTAEFPSYAGSQASISGQFAAPTIMDY